ncbi:MAG: hypothetical protein GWM98_06890 [Nitrospinaceae bacterium]|nr:hypothetical protein [Nitrospinaceae bacterium]NIR54271.1 hypothetical protein [Nitrospinaceae bacterium]NIS84688.1 hypothetical protein [Nitrospinaceae bacterium]NIT81483.1 hypothetical protein [Nitrospinaceae bacterium]NIU43767.1 hypothetical protein [Nitrospinaceae bacterium]
MDAPKASGPVFTDNNCLNLYYVNELYRNIAQSVSGRMRELHGIDVPISSGIWGGTYLIADPQGNSLRRIWRLYCIVNLPQNSPLDKHENLEKLVMVYFKTFAEAFKPYGLILDLKMWGGRLPHSNKTRPTITMHLEDANRKINWLRPIIVWNEAHWEQSIIYDSVRLVKELKDSLNLDKGPVLTDPKTIKYLLQDVIITYRTLEKAASEDFLEHAEPIIADLTQTFLEGLFDPLQIRDLYHMVLENALVYGYEQTLDAHYRKYELDVTRVETWPVEKINWVPEELQDKLIPPIQEIFATFKANLEAQQTPAG